MHMISKKDLSDAEMDTLTKSCSPTIVITANGEVQTHEEATVYAKELDTLLKMKSSRTRQQFYRSESFAMKTDILMNGSTVKNHISQSTARTPSRQEIDHPPSSSSSSTSPITTVSSDSETREREDLSGIDSHPVLVSSSHVEEMVERRRPVVDQANQKSKTK